MKNDTQLTTTEEQQIGIVMPAVSPKQFVEAWKEYEQLKKALTSKSDIQIIQGNEFLKKSYWRKIATAFNLSVEITEEHKEILDGNNLVYHFTQKATAPNGRFTYGTGSCDRMEKGRANTIHNTRSTAETRAFNRAVSNLVGGGEVSAEEIVGEAHEVKTSPKPLKAVKKTGSSNWTEEDETLAQESLQSPTGGILKCSDCGKDIPQNVSDYSLDRYGKELCFTDQKKEQV